MLCYAFMGVVLRIYLGVRNFYSLLGINLKPNNSRDACLKFKIDFFKLCCTSSDSNEKCSGLL